ncbi:MAG TPA: hypothetical protein VK718_05140 [Ferruginibacter sp.]|jgi:hypothetical protein|nr:hypothetical protein [Ferruginibacter sp.]
MGHKKHKEVQHTINVTPVSLSLKIAGYACLLIGLLSFVGIFELTYIENTIDGVKLFIVFAFLGLVVSLPFYLIIYRTVPEFKLGKYIPDRWKNLLYFLPFGLFFLTPCMASFINRTYSAEEVNCDKYEVVRKSTSASKYGRYSRYGPDHYIFVEIDNDEKRLTVSESYWNTITEKDKINLCIQKGSLGYDYVKIND